MAGKGYFLHAIWINGELAFVAKAESPEACAEMISEEIEFLYQEGLVEEEDKVAYGPMTPSDIALAMVQTGRTF